MREYRKADMIYIGIACVVIVVTLVAGAVFIYQRCRQLGRSIVATGASLETEKMIALSTLK